MAARGVITCAALIHARSGAGVTPGGSTANHFAQAMPIEHFAALGSVDDLLGLIAAEVGDPDALDPGLDSAGAIEALRALLARS
jgi:hypothetical protein